MTKIDGLPFQGEAHPDDDGPRSGPDVQADVKITVYGSGHIERLEAPPGLRVAYELIDDDTHEWDRTEVYVDGAIVESHINPY